MLLSLSSLRYLSDKKDMHLRLKFAWSSRSLYWFIQYQ